MRPAGLPINPELIAACAYSTSAAARFTLQSRRPSNERYWPNRQWWQPQKDFAMAVSSIALANTGVLDLDFLPCVTGLAPKALSLIVISAATGTPVAGLPSNDSVSPPWPVTCCRAERHHSRVPQGGLQSTQIGFSIFVICAFSGRLATNTFCTHPP